MTETLLKKPQNEALLLQAAERYGTPTYVYEASTVRERIERLRSHLRGAPVQLLYAMKANGALPLLRIMKEEGLGIDAVSPAELELALRIGFEGNQILFSANNMTDDEMDFAAQEGVVLNIGELSRLERFGKKYPGESVCIRFNPQIGAGHHRHVITAGEKSKFGIPVAQTDEVLSLAHRFELNICGVHQHIGSGILDTETAWKACAVLLDVAAKFHSLRFINFGGGLGVPYRPGEQPLDMERWEDLIVSPLRTYRDRHPSPDLSFRFEPGRYLVAEAGTLLVRVNTVKESHGRTFAGVDSGMGHLVRPAIYNAYHATYNLSNPNGTCRIYDVVGNICESSDFFARDRAVQEIREGDVLAILDTGAYGISMASMYNIRSLPAEVFIDGTDHVVIRKRESPAELIDRLYPEL